MKQLECTLTEAGNAEVSLKDLHLDPDVSISNSDSPLVLMSQQSNNRFCPFIIIPSHWRNRCTPHTCVNVILQIPTSCFLNTCLL